jgi:predicted kinase
VLFVFGGLPGVGKTELSMQLAKRIGAVHLRIDTIEQAMRDSGVNDIGPKGYNVAYNVAYDNLILGLKVIIKFIDVVDHIKSSIKNKTSFGFFGIFTQRTSSSIR